MRECWTHRLQCARLCACRPAHTAALRPNLMILLLTVQVAVVLGARVVHILALGAEQLYSGLARDVCSREGGRGARGSNQVSPVCGGE